MTIDTSSALPERRVFVEVNPIVDRPYLSPLVAARTLVEALTGIAMRKKGIEDPYYADPKWVDHGVPLGR